MPSQTAIRFCDPPSPLVTAAALYKNLGYDPSGRLAPIALLFTSPELLAVNPSASGGMTSRKRQLCKGKPEPINFASAGSGIQPHLLGEMLKSVADIDIVMCPIKACSGMASAPDRLSVFLQHHNISISAR